MRWLRPPPGHAEREGPRETEAPALPLSHDPFEAEILAHDVEAMDADTFAAGGNGVVVPTLPEATPSELYSEFDADQERPADEAP
jgi:hypothetical protein